MSGSGEMGEMLTCAPVGRGEALVPVLCVEATARTQEALEAALQAMVAADSNSSSSTAEPVAPSPSSAAALQTLHKLPGTRLRVSPYTTVHVLRAFLQSEAGAAKDAKDPLATAQFFAVRVHAAAGARVGAAAANEEEEAMIALHAQTTLQEVLSGGGVLQLPSEDVPEAALVLLYSKETQYGDMDGGDFLCIGLCAAMVACCVAMCVSSAVENNKEKKQNMEHQQQMQQQHQNQYYENQQGGYQGYNENQNQNYNNQPYYQGPNGYGAPPQQPMNGYPVAQPAYYNYSGDPALAQQQPQQPQYYNANPGNQQQVYYQQPGQGGPYNNSNYQGAGNPNAGYPSTNPL